MRILNHLVEVDSVLIIGLHRIKHPGQYLQLIVAILVPPGLRLPQLLVHPRLMLPPLQPFYVPITIRAHPNLKRLSRSSDSSYRSLPCRSSGGWRRPPGSLNRGRYRGVLCDTILNYLLIANLTSGV